MNMSGDEFSCLFWSENSATSIGDEKSLCAGPLDSGLMIFEVASSMRYSVYIMLIANY